MRTRRCPRTGMPTTGPTEAERFESLTDRPDGPDACFGWKGQKWNGIGAFRKDDGTVVSARLYAYLTANDGALAGNRSHVRPDCRRDCVNAAHISGAVWRPRPRKTRTYPAGTRQVEVMLTGKLARLLDKRRKRRGKRVTRSHETIRAIVGYLDDGGRVVAPSARGHGRFAVDLPHALLARIARRIRGTKVARSDVIVSALEWYLPG